MTTDQRRDAAMDRLLGAALRTPQGVPEACPSADDLAAFAEGALSSAEREAFERHAADCARCQQALALIASFEPAAELQRARHGWLPWPALRWAVPAAAVLATAGLLYLAALPSTTVPQKATDMARIAHEQPGGLADRAAAPGAALSDRSTPPSEPASPAAPAAHAPSGSGGGDGQRGRQLPAETAKQDDTRPLARAERRNQAAAPTVIGGVVGGVVGGIVEELPRPAAGAPTQAKTVQPAPPAAGPVPPPATPPSGVAGGPPTVAAAVPPPGPVQAQDAAAKPQAMRSAAGAMAGMVAESVAVAQPIVAPGGATQWRLAGMNIVRSRDGGKTWQLQAFKPTATLSTGAAPSPDVCWLVGRDGLVLRTTDAEHWEVRAFPERVTLVAVQARDADSATVTTADGRPFTTADGGATWAVKR